MKECEDGILKLKDGQEVTLKPLEGEEEEKFLESARKSILDRRSKHNKPGRGRRGGGRGRGKLEIFTLDQSVAIVDYKKSGGGGTIRKAWVIFYIKFTFISLYTGYLKMVWTSSDSLGQNLKYQEKYFSY